MPKPSMVKIELETVKKLMRIISEANKPLIAYQPDEPELMMREAMRVKDIALTEVYAELYKLRGD